MSSLNTPSSSSTLWATASKEWVIQPKPKPGRKPKKDLPVPSEDDTEIDIKGRRIQNRAAQRAFRERKQSQLSELQARVQLYEQGEIERNIALQNIAKRLKEENDKLRNENILLQEKLAEIQSESSTAAGQTSSQIKKKRWRDGSESPSAICLHPSLKKKSRTSPSHPSKPVAPDVYLPSPSSMVSSPDPHEAVNAHFPPNFDIQSNLNRSSFETFESISSNVKADDVLSSFPSLGCGFCDGGAICLCHEISVQDVVERTIEPAEIESGNFQRQINVVPETTTAAIAASNNQGSILDNLPAYQSPLPIRRRPGGGSVNSVFPVTPVTPAAESNSFDATCSGDPSNCAACGDDAFGKAFCSAIVNTGQEVCNNCPSKASSGIRSGCCGAGSCGSCPSQAVLSPVNMQEHPSHVDSAKYISTNDAWKRLKAHPNVDFADLSLLAEVVASRSKCMGPQLNLAPTPQSSLPSGQFTSHTFAHLRGRSPPLRLVPQEILLECGRRRVRHVHADGVQEALRLLDAKFS